MSLVLVPLDVRLLATAVRSLTRSEPRFARVVARHGPPPLWPREPGFETLVLLMLEQQVSLAQARAMYARIVAAAGRVTPAAIATLGESGLRDIGVTRQKSAYLSALATQLRLGQLDLGAMNALPDAEVAEALDALRGVGPWTALARRAEAWRPHRAAAARLLWHQYLSERGRA